MNKSKLITLLNTFTSSERRSFSDFVASPFFNKNKDLILLYQHLRKIKAENTDKLSKEIVAQKIFPDRLYDEKEMGYLMSSLLTLAEAFIGFQSYNSQPLVKEYHTLKAYLQKDLYKHYQYLHKKIVKKRKENTPRSLTTLHEDYLIAELEEMVFIKNPKRKFDHRIQEAADRFDEYFLAKKLKACCGMLNQQKMISANYQLHLIDEITTYLAQAKDNHSPIIIIYYHIMLSLIEEENEAHYKELRYLFKRYIDEVSSEVMKELILSLINFCIRKIRKGHNEYISECLSLYLEGIDSQVLFDKDALSPWTYKNVIKLAIRQKRYEWTEQFIQHYNQFLSPEFRQNALHFNLADLYFHQKDYPNALSQLQQVTFSDIYYNLDSKVILIKIYYETNEEEALLSQIASFTMFLKRNKLISNQARKPYLNFNNQLYQLLRKNYQKLPSIKMKIESQPIAEKNWLLNICSQMEKQKLF